jgi:hypothetical protein
MFSEIDYLTNKLKCVVTEAMKTYFFFLFSQNVTRLNITFFLQNIFGPPAKATDPFKAVEENSQSLLRSRIIFMRFPAPGEKLTRLRHRVQP